MKSILTLLVALLLGPLVALHAAPQTQIAVDRSSRNQVYQFTAKGPGTAFIQARDSQPDI
jgi:hypothetical protein